jgi:hypothetical protein
MRRRALRNLLRGGPEDRSVRQVRRRAPASKKTVDFRGSRATKQVVRCDMLATHKP